MVEHTFVQGSTSAYVALINRYRDTVGFDWVVALGSPVALSLAIVTAIISSRR